ncbi:MAG: hypothetical protein ABGZ24_25900, partial [Fuerstiella sp.]
GVESPEAVEAVLRTLEPQLKAESESARRSFIVSHLFPRLIRNARGTGATAMATGIRNIEIRHWGTLLPGSQGKRLQECDPQVLAALQEMRYSVSR